MFTILIINEIESQRTEKLIKSGVQEGSEILSQESRENLGRFKSMFKLLCFTCMRTPFTMYSLFSGDRNIQERFGVPG
jgi:hypothetical protein